MPEVNVRSDAADVEQIMQQIRARIREKRGADYTDAELKRLAADMLERFTGPSGLQSDLLDRIRAKAEEPQTYQQARGIRRLVFRLMHPFQKRIHKQVMADVQPYFEIIHHLVVEVTRLGLETQTLKMRVESLSSRLDFDERRAKAFEGVSQHRPAPVQRSRPEPSAPRAATEALPGPTRFGGAPAQAEAQAPVPGNGGPGVPAGGGATPPGPGGRPDGQSRPDGERRRRRRRRRRRPGQGPGDGSVTSAPAGAPQHGSPEAAPASNGAADSDDDGGDEGPDGDEGASDQ